MVSFYIGVYICQSYNFPYIPRQNYSNFAFRKQIEWFKSLFSCNHHDSEQLQKNCQCCTAKVSRGTIIFSIDS